MPEENRDTTQGDKSVYVEKGNVTINYPSGKKIRKYLGPLPFVPEVFLGREDDLMAVHDKLFAGNNLLLLVNGEGGIGKTTLASKYYQAYHEKYTHLAWVFAEKSLPEAILTLAIPLQVIFPERMAEGERLQTLLAEMAELKKPCLLVIDNANSLDDLQAHYHALKACPNFHLLLTTRITEFEHAETHAIKPLDEKSAIELFVKHYPAHNPAENELLQQILQAVGCNTLVIELLAKNLGNFNNRLRQRYLLGDLLDDLQKKGLFGLSQSGTVTIAYKHEGLGLRKEKPEAILAAMYNLTELAEGEKAMLSVFALLPAEPLPFSTLDELLPGTENLDKTLLSLAKKGWIEFNEKSASFKCSPVVQQVTRIQNRVKLFEDAQLLINTLIVKLEYEGDLGHLVNISYETGAFYARYAESILNCIRKAEERLAILAERVGSFHRTTGNLNKALTFFEQDAKLTKGLFEANHENADIKNNLAVSYERLGQINSDLGNLDKALSFFEECSRLSKEFSETDTHNVAFKQELAISYEKLGQTHSALGNPDKALSFFEDETRLFEELHEDYPHNVAFKNGLAVSYAKLGDTHSTLGNPDKALSFFEKYSRFSKELHEDYPQNVAFKNGLAISYCKLGEIHSELGNPDKALTFFEQDAQLTKELYKDYPQNVAFKNGLAISYSKLGDTHSTLGNPDKALSFFEEYSRLRKELYEADPHNVAFKNGLAVSYAKLGEFNRDERGNTATARSYFEKAKALWAELVKSSPSNAEFQRNWSNINKTLEALE